MHLPRWMIAAVIAVLIGVGVWLFLTYEANAPDLQDEQTMIDGLARGQMLYVKRMDYRRTRIGLLESGDYPQTVIDESWMEAGPDGAFDLWVETSRSPDGQLIVYFKAEDGVQTYSDLVADLYWEETSGNGWSSINYVKFLWNASQSIVDDESYRFAGHGELNGKTSLIYESRSSESAHDPATLSKIEFVEDWPVLVREAIYEVDADGKETLLESNTLLEYRVLPLGATIPVVEVDLPTRSWLEAHEQEWNEVSSGQEEAK